MYLAYYYPFSTPEMVQENTGFEIDVSRAQLFEGPTPDIIKVIREEIDPGQALHQGSQGLNSGYTKFNI